MTRFCRVLISFEEFDGLRIFFGEIVESFGGAMIHCSVQIVFMYHWFYGWSFLIFLQQSIYFSPRTSLSASLLLDRNCQVLDFQE